MPTQTPGPRDDTGAPLRQRLREALRAAMKTGDRTAVAALRSTLAAIDNAEAVDGPASAHGGLAIEQSPVGVGAADVERRVLTEEQVAGIVRAEVAEREAAARDYERAGRPERAERLRSEAAVLSAHLTPADTPPGHRPPAWRAAMTPASPPAGEGVLPVYAITRLSAADFAARVPELADLLLDAVAGGHSLGFVDPFAHGAALAWWEARSPAVADGSLLVWACRGPRSVDGTVSLALEPEPNGRHRAEVVKLMVRRDARGRGLGRALLATAEQAAAELGAALLLLDTETGSVAESLYLGAGWSRYGIVPEYAADPSGVLRDCSFFYKRLS
ncbi:MAG: GatB/YqeY domain-containing protein [Actinoallomurus sp.]